MNVRLQGSITSFISQSLLSPARSSPGQPTRGQSRQAPTSLDCNMDFFPSLFSPWCSLRFLGSADVDLFKRVISFQILNLFPSFFPSICYKSSNPYYLLISIHSDCCSYNSLHKLACKTRPCRHGPQHARASGRGQAAMGSTIAR
jgi:hypothetical protein